MERESAAASEVETAQPAQPKRDNLFRYSAACAGLIVLVAVVLRSQHDGGCADPRVQSNIYCACAVWCVYIVHVRGWSGVQRRVWHGQGWAHNYDLCHRHHGTVCVYANAQPLLGIAEPCITSTQNCIYYIAIRSYPPSLAIHGVY